MDLSEDQFHEHLEEWHRRLGITFGHNYVELPGGHKLHTVGQEVTMRGHMGGRMERGIYPGSHLFARVPSETGRLHHLLGHISDDPATRRTSNYLAFDIGTPHGDEWLDYRADYGGPRSQIPEERDPEHFHNLIQKSLRESPVPSPEARKTNVLEMQELSEHQGKILVQSRSSSNKDSRFYHFSVGSGRLTDW